MRLNYWVFLLFTMMLTAFSNTVALGMLNTCPYNAHLNSILISYNASKAFDAQQQLADQVHYYRILVVVLILLAIAIFIVIYFAIFNRRRLAAMRQEMSLAQAQKYISGLENERNRIGKELHDGIANDLLALEIKLSSAKNNDSSWIVPEIAKIRDSVRNISHELMPPEFSQLGLDDILSYYLNDVVAKTDLKATFTTDNSLPVGAVSEHVALEIFRIVQELLSNIIKHSKASFVILNIESLTPAVARISISDDGIEWSAHSVSSGSGVKTVADRAMSIAANIEYKRVSNRNIKCITFAKAYGC